jgi:hypothetical protein
MYKAFPFSPLVSIPWLKLKAAMFRRKYELVN